MVDLQEKLASATAQITTDQIASNIASFNCHRAEAALHTLQTNLDDKTAAANYWHEQVATVSKERDNLLGVLNDIRSRFAWDLPSFQPAADNFTSVSKRLINDLSRRFLPHGLAPDSRLARLEVELDELRAANIEYARELRELRRRY